MATSGEAWRVETGDYLGDVSALCFLHCPWESSVPYLLAGTGAQLFVYDIEHGKLLSSSHVFDGIRVHGIHSSCYLLKDFDTSTCVRISAVTVAVFGERRVKLFDVHLRGKSGSNNKLKGHISLDLLQVLPTFGHWVMDVRFLKGLDKGALKQNYGTEEKIIGSLLAIGLSDNSVYLWDIGQSCCVLEVKCAERCLLYSMSLWGDSVKTLCIASGTICNEILIWKIVSQQTGAGEVSLEVPPCTDTDTECTNKIWHIQHSSLLLNRLTGHEGSIFRIAWSHNGSTLISASDDRSARVWICNFTGTDIHDAWTTSYPTIVAGPILFGHSARIWDCYISDVLIVTASEDCTCCIWQPNGEHVTTIRGHIGRGVWRCVYDPGTSILITAGSDSLIKMQCLTKQTVKHMLHTTVKDNYVDDNMEIFNICLLGDVTLESPDFMDSKSEYVRCLQLAQERCLYVATNLGFLHCIDLTVPGEEKWTTIVKSDDKVPIVCLDLLVLKSPKSPEFQEDWVAIGDGKGRVTVVQVISSNLKHEVSSTFVWSSERQRQLLGIYWCKSLGNRHLFTTDPKGRIKLWRLRHPSRELIQSREMVEGNLPEEAQASLIAEFVSNFSARIVCMDADIENELLVCGDQRGNLVVFKLSTKLLALDLNDTILRETFQAYCSFKGAHGISSVVSISVARSNGNQIHICSTGKDGCICSYIFDDDTAQDSNKLIFTGIKDVPEITMVEGVVNYINVMGDGIQRSFAAGFTSVDFLLWDITNESELLRVPCGGWRRPHSYFIGVMPEIQNCFAYLKDHTIYVLRNWVPNDQIKLSPQSLHTQFHGREIHSVHFIPMLSSLFCSQNNLSCPKTSWIATGSEDGTVRITRYSSKQMDKLSLSLLLGEHVGGSAVRSVTIVSKIYPLELDGHRIQDSHSCSMENKDSLLVLLSVGAKQVLTSWLLKWVNESDDGYENELSNKLDPACTSNFEKYSSERNHKISFQWLSTYMQPRFHKPPKNLGGGEKQSHTNGTIPRIVIPEALMEHASEQDGSGGEKLKPIIDQETQDDWRYLAVTAFMVHVTDPRSVVCFVVTACSNATLTVQALLLPDRLWFEVAVLDHERALILALQHVVIPVYHRGSDSTQNTFLVFGGATTGSIVVWDLTDIVNDFTSKISSLNPGKDIVAQRRPRTGRGSQGGRRWRFLRNQNGNSKDTASRSDAVHIAISKPLSDTLLSEDVREEISLNTSVNRSQFTCSEEQDPENELEVAKKYKKGSLKCPTECDTNPDTRGSHEVTSMGRLHDEIQKLHPLHVFDHAHQSGVNCLHISTLNGNEMLNTENSDLLYCVVSGGDDQALHIASFKLHVQETEKKSLDAPIYNERKEPCAYSRIQHCRLAEQIIGNTTSNTTDDKTPGLRVAYKFTCLSQEVIGSAHSSSIKGVWTDGHWVFSTGLDQRIRYWRFSCLNEIYTIREHFSSIINVPEPEALHTIVHEKRTHYQIAINCFPADCCFLGGNY
ncbi:hypothetical protein SUGI_0381750 [Cryptomeria japonica]|nr:hypothetical protein SUGI_0381750 [Cryptomeria japonica]